MAPLLRMLLSLLVGTTVPATLPSLEPGLPPSGTWAWPVVGPVIEPFDPPETPYGSGHRGIDIAAPVGTTVVAPEAGIVTFAGTVGGELFVTLDHGAGLTSTSSWVSAALVAEGDVVPRGWAIALTGNGHPGSSTPHLHFGVRLDGVYLDPMAFLETPNVSDLIRLAPMDVAA